MDDQTNSKRELIEVAVEHALLEMGPLELEKVESILENDYNCKIGDCFEHPEYLKRILNDLFGYCYQDIFDTIERIVEDIKVNGEMEKFLTVLRSK